MWTVVMVGDVWPLLGECGERVVCGDESGDATCQMLDWGACRNPRVRIFFIEGLTNWKNIWVCDSTLIFSLSVSPSLQWLFVRGKISASLDRLVFFQNRWLRMHQLTDSQPIPWMVRSNTSCRHNDVVVRMLSNGSQKRGTKKSETRNRELEIGSQQGCVR